LLFFVLVAGLGLGVAACIPTPTSTSTPTPTSTPTGTPTPTATPEPNPVVITTVIDYAYDPLYRLIAADYDSGWFFHYVYDAVGNRLLQETHNATNVYAYDAANRLTAIRGLLNPTIA
jgi:YD repeat-containing protein